MVIIVCINLIITGDAGEVCSKEVLKSQNKSFVPQFTNSKSGNLNKEQPPKVMYLVVVGEGNDIINIYYSIRENLHWIKVSPNPTTLQKNLVENFHRCGKVAYISSTQILT